MSSSSSCVFEKLQIEAHSLSMYLDAALREKSYVTYLHRVDIRNLAGRVEGTARILLGGGHCHFGYSSTSIRNRIHFLESQLQTCIQRNVFTSLYGLGKTIPAIQRAIVALQGLAAALGSSLPKDPLERPEIDLEDLRADQAEYFRFGFLEKRGSSSPIALGSYFKVESFPLSSPS